MENHEQNPTPEPRKKVSMDGVLNELRSVISGLGAPASEPEEAATPLPPSMNSVPAPTELKSPPPAPPSSDADFWKGNVLGWSSAPEGDPLPPAPAPPVREDLKPAPMAYEKPALEGEPFSLDTPFVNAPPPSDEDAGFAANPWGVQPMNPVPPPPKPPVAQQPPVDPLPPPPAAPAFERPEFEPPAFERPAFDPPVFESPTPLPPAPVPKSETADPGLPAEFAIPIPGTAMKDAAPQKPNEKSDDPLNLEQTELKPKGLVQIACLFPDGQERQGQQFVAKLRELGEKSKAHLKIEPVFVSGWPEGRADVPAWVKSATLSGAELMFILAFKKDLEQFKSKMPDPIQTGIRARIIAVEQLGLRTLYADILIELERGK